MSGRRPPKLCAVDLFCGAGGLTEGFKAAGYEVVYALDRDPDCCDTYALNHPEVTLERAPIDRFTPAELSRRIGRSVDVVIGGPSCQGFSTAGRRHGAWVRADDERNNLWSYMLKLVEQLKPRAFVLENVPGMVYWKEGEFGGKILKGFRDAGYVVDFQILLAADFGVPQVRRRVLMVGRRGKKGFVFPEPTHLGGFRRDSLEKWESERRRRKLLRHVTCWEAIADLPALGDGEGAQTAIYPVVRSLTPYARKMKGKSTVVHDHEVFAMAEAHQALIRWVPQGGTWRDIPGHLLPERFYGMRRTDSSTLLGRLDPGRPAYTITTSFHNVTVGCYVHPWEDRTLSVREGARLQSFPDRYRFEGTLTSRYRQVGNAVPPMVAEAVGRELARQLRRAVEPRKPKVLVRPAKEMPPPPTDEATGRRMKAQKRANTLPEVLLRKEVHALGLRYRVCTKPVPGLRREADLVFATAKVAVFVDGCFWHGCPTHARATKSNTVWWADKIAANKKRDDETTLQLTGLGWRVLRIWEHEQPKAAARRVELLVRGLRNVTSDAATEMAGEPVPKAAVGGRRPIA